LNAGCIARILGGALLAVVDVAVALDIETRWVPEIDGEAATRPRLVLSGRVQAGDAEKLARAFAILPLDQFDGIVLHSPGGALTEGRRIGELFEHFLVRVIVREPFMCASACFMMYAGAAMRHAHGFPQPNTLAVHRGFVQPSRAAVISIEALEPMLAFEQEVMPRWLEEHGVPGDIIAIIVAGKVAPLVAVNQEDIDRIGPRSPRYDTWIETRCTGSGKHASWTVRELPPQVAPEELAQAQERRQCEATRVDAERRYRQFALQTALDAADRREAMRTPPAKPSRQ
jgi:hypothetical protein